MFFFLEFKCIGLGFGVGWEGEYGFFFIIFYRKGFFYFYNFGFGVLAVLVINGSIFLLENKVKIILNRRLR